MNYKPTGFPRGRPRKGEIRPPTPGGINQAKFREEKKKTDPDYFAVQADYQRLWALANTEAHRKNKKAYRQRQKLWDAANANGGVDFNTKIKM